MASEPLSVPDGFVACVEKGCAVFDAAAAAPTAWTIHVSLYGP